MGFFSDIVKTFTDNAVPIVFGGIRGIPGGPMGIAAGAGIGLATSLAGKEVGSTVRDVTGSKTLGTIAGAGTSLALGGGIKKPEAYGDWLSMVKAVNQNRLSDRKTPQNSTVETPSPRASQTQSLYNSFPGPLSQAQRFGLGRGLDRRGQRLSQGLGVTTRSGTMDAIQDYRRLLYNTYGNADALKYGDGPPIKSDLDLLNQQSLLRQSPGKGKGEGGFRMAPIGPFRNLEDAAARNLDVTIQDTYNAGRDYASTGNIAKITPQIATSAVLTPGRGNGGSFRAAPVTSGRGNGTSFRLTPAPVAAPAPVANKSPIIRRVTGLNR